jgi:uncharacterized protein
MTPGFEPLHPGLPVYRSGGTQETGGTPETIGGTPTDGGEAVGALYYAPGYLVRAADRCAARALEDELSARASGGGILGGAPDGGASLPADRTAARLAEELLRHARAAQAAWNQRLSEPFRPLCLTIYPENRCNLRCAYCYADPAPVQGSACPPVSLAAVRAAAEVTARNCQAQGRPLTLVLHGGGEPTLHPRALARIVETVESVAAVHGVELFKYIATNGVMAPQTARWVAQHFDRVGLSCDGPAEIQNQQRPISRPQRLANITASAPFVERTADLLHAAGRPLDVRVTLTPQTVARQEEIVAYLLQRLRPQEIRIEPLYQTGRSVENGLAWSLDHAEIFIQHFRAAQALARSAGVRLVFTGARPGEIHGPFCQIFRQVLNLVPGDVATPCFQWSDAAQARRRDAVIGQQVNGQFALDEAKISALRELLVYTPPRCVTCFNRWHCAGACPENCLLEDDPAQPERPGEDFRCRVQMRLAEGILADAAGALEHSGDPLAGRAILFNAPDLP